jgi:hypothetical protein
MGAPMPTQTSDAAAPQGSNVVVVKQKRSWAGTFLVFIGLMGLLCAGYFGAATLKLVPEIKNPFTTRVDDRSGPVLLESIQDLSLFVAARGNFQVVVDYREDRAYVPDFISSYHALFVGHGSVEAYVDFATIDEGAIEVSPDGTEVTITLPEPQLSEVRLDLNQSRIYALDEGLFETIRRLVREDINRQGDLYRLAVDKIEQAARQSDLLERARENTRITLEGMMRALGFERVTVNFVANPL